MSKKKREFSLSEWPACETLIAAVAATLHGILAAGWADPWSKISADAQQSIYQTGAGVVAIIASLAALGLATGGAGERARVMRRLYGKQLRRNWRALLLTSAVAPMLAVIAQILAGSGVAWAPYLFEFALLWTALRLARLAWLVDRLLGIQIGDEVNPPTEAIGPLTVSEDYQNRMRA